MEYYEGGGEALINLTWERADALQPTSTWTPIPPAGPTATPTPPTWSGGGSGDVAFTPLGGDPAWNGEYFNNATLTAPATFGRSDSAIDFNWGQGSPGNGINNDNFSVRWTRTIQFPQGRFRFRATVDDGVRLYIDGGIVIDQWKDEGVFTYWWIGIWARATTRL